MFYSSVYPLFSKWYISAILILVVKSKHLNGDGLCTVEDNVCIVVRWVANVYGRIASVEGHIGEASVADGPTLVTTAHPRHHQHQDSHQDCDPHQGPHSASHHCWQAVALCNTRHAFKCGPDFIIMMTIGGYDCVYSSLEYFVLPIVHKRLTRICPWIELLHMKKLWRISRIDTVTSHHFVISYWFPW